MTTRTFTVAELDDIPVAPWSKKVLANLEGDEHRWYTVRQLVFEHEGKFWMVDYMQPSTEIQEGQAVWCVDSLDHPDSLVEATEVHQVPRIEYRWLTVEPLDIADPAERWLIDVVSREFDDLNDEEDPPFGCYPVSESLTGAALRVSPDQDPEHWDDQDPPSEPVVLIVAKRIR